jgi:alkanesulfonate monooxygenase SsuD/methylene tetrahydromethanopterin reductase-like flavin-dependent oxidoreductase (luciferase family)
MTTSIDVPPPIQLGVALDGAGWHPAAWREPDARPTELFTPRYWTELVQEAEWGLLDFVTIEDSLALQSTRRGQLDERIDQVRGRLDATLVAARVAPDTSSIGIIPVVTTTHTEPFHVSKAIATLDYVSHGRAGLQARVSATNLEARQFGRRDIPTFPIATLDEIDAAADGTVIGELFDEAADFIEVTRRLWDSWEDDAEIRDVATGRFIDREKLHYIDFEGAHFSVKGPSITPRPPQGQPLVSVLAHVPVAFALAARRADLVFVTPKTTDVARTIVSTVRTHEQAAGRVDPPLRIFADLVVFLDDDATTAQARKDRLDELDGHPLRSDALIFTGSPDELLELMLEWRAAGIDGFRLRPGALPHDLDVIAHELVGVLQDRGAFRLHYEDTTLRARLGLTRPTNRYATSEPVAL